jgi:hypothetical protein
LHIKRKTIMPAKKKYIYPNRQRISGYVYDKHKEMWEEIQRRLPGFTNTQILKCALISLYNTRVASPDYVPNTAVKIDLTPKKINYSGRADRSIKHYAKIADK